MAERSSISERLDAVLADLPEEAWSISHDDSTGYRVCTIVIDWRLVPGEAGCEIRKQGKLRVLPGGASGITEGSTR